MGSLPLVEVLCKSTNMVLKEHASTEHPMQPSAGHLFDHRPPGRKVVDAVIAPLALGAVTGATLHIPVLYWILSALAALAAVAAGREHLTWVSGLQRGLVAGLLFGVGVTIVYFLIRSGVSVRVRPSPSLGTPVVTAIAGGILTVIGVFLLGRRTAH